jgi:hypothetical protein
MVVVPKYLCHAFHAAVKSRGSVHLSIFTDSSLQEVSCCSEVTVTVTDLKPSSIMALHSCSGSDSYCVVDNHLRSVLVFHAE